MRRLLPILLLFATMMAWAGNVTESEALQKAKAFIDGQRTTHPQRQMRLAAKSTQVNKKLTTVVEDRYYVFNVGQDNGYVIVSADDRTPAILGYADEGSFDVDRIPDNMRSWLQGYTEQLEYLSTHATTKMAEITEHQAIRPLIQSTWDQGEPYYNKCPMDGNYRSLTGCLATAMAQILNYYKYPEATTATIPGYTTVNKQITVDDIPVTTIDWANMKNKYTGNESAVQKDAVATLMQLCGASIKMDYSYNDSYAYIFYVSESLRNYFDYDAGTRHADRRYYFAKEWDELIYTELEEKRPVYFLGQSLGGGHAFIIDGYSKEGLYHVNWGWGGSCNGYFLLSILDPRNNSGNGASTSNDGYSMDQEIVIGIQPNTGKEPVVEIKMSTNSIYTDQTIVNKENGTFNFSYITETRNATGYTNSFDLGVGIFNKDNNLVYAQKQWSATLDNTWGWSDADHRCNVANLPDGTYVITNISREQGSSTWLQNTNSSIYYITATVNGNQMTLQNPFIDFDCAITINGNKEVNCRQEAIATIKNNGTFFNNQLYLLVDGYVMGGRFFEIAPDGSAELDMSFIPRETGEKEIAFAYKETYYDEGQKLWVDNYQEIGKTTVTFNAAKTNELKISNGMVLNADAIGNINSNVAKLRFEARNAKTTSEYYDNICVRVLQNSDGGNYYWDITSVEIPVRLGKLKSETFEVEVPLEVDGYYWFNISYKTDGYYLGNDLWDDRNINLIPFKVEIPAPTAEELGVEPITKTKTPSIVYDLQGRRLDNSLMKKGLYIKDGKKIIKR